MRNRSGYGGEFVMEVVMVEMVASMVIVGEFVLWCDVGNFGKELWWLQECCSIGVQV